MSNKEVIKSLDQIKTFCSASQVETIDYVIELMEKLDKAGVENPLSADFTKVINS